MKIEIKNFITKNQLNSIYILLFFLFSSLACARTSLYRINLNYEPQKAVPYTKQGIQKYNITVSVFNDRRVLDDTLIIGKRVFPDGKETRVLSRFLEPSHAVASGIKDILSGAGYTVRRGMPSWDLRESSIKSQWGTLVIGGSIDELLVICQSGFPAMLYEATVRLRVVVADVQSSKIIYTTTLESTSSLKHLRFSEHYMQQQLNSALSLAIEKILEGNELENKIIEAGSVRSENLTE